jgi:tripartite-type tricarboxylate transporter receptor subunit TctC
LPSPRPAPEGHPRAHAEGAGHQRGDRQLARRVWRPGITAEQRKALTTRWSQGHQEQGWAESLEKNDWTPAWMAGDEFDEFVDNEFASLRATMVKSGMI